MCVCLCVLCGLPGTVCIVLIVNNNSHVFNQWATHMEKVSSANHWIKSNNTIEWFKNKRHLNSLRFDWSLIFWFEKKKNRIFMRMNQKVLMTLWHLLCLKWCRCFFFPDYPSTGLHRGGLENSIVGNMYLAFSQHSNIVFVIGK